MTNTNDLKKILKNQNEILKKLDLVSKEEIEEIEEEKNVESEEIKQLEEMKELETIEKSIQEKTKDSPLKKITYHDITKGFIGAFAGIVGHFAFAEGKNIAEELSMLRATNLLIFSFILLLLFIYFTGFRKVELANNKLIPLRGFTIFFTAIITIILVLGLFGFITISMGFEEIYKQVAAISILATLGAGAADMIGEK